VSVIVDAWAQLPNARFLAQPWWDSLRRWTGAERTEPPTLTVSDTLAAMDDAGVSKALLCAWSSPGGMLIDNDEVAAVVRSHPDRFAGVAAVDLRSPMAAITELRRAVLELGFIAVRIVPWVWNLPPNDRRYYPVYATCVELGIPFCTQVGHTGPLCPSEPGRPIPYLDDVLLEFPELVVVGGHVGYPWIDEVISSQRSIRTSTSTRRRTRCTACHPRWSSTCADAGVHASSSARTGRCSARSGRSSISHRSRSTTRRRASSLARTWCACSSSINTSQEDTHDDRSSGRAASRPCVARRPGNGVHAVRVERAERV
jgi:hypothetical protein